MENEILLLEKIRNNLRRKAHKDATGTHVVTWTDIHRCLWNQLMKIKPIKQNQ